MVDTDVFPLTSFNEREEGIVHSISGGRGITSRLAAMGIASGIKVRILRNTGGPVVVQANETRIAIGRGQASRIMLIKAKAKRYERAKAG
jgi:Fe2+ transport system protein FeoA